MKKILSYVFPFTKKIKSDNNGILEISWYNGKKILDSKNANYSYGSLQEILNVGLSKIEFEYIHKVLLLGLGGGSVIHSLQDKFNFQGKITAIEIDGVMIDIAKDEFDIKNDKSLKIVNADALSYLKSNTAKFDLVIIDLFIDKNVPDFCFTEQFWQLIEGRITNQGYVIFNASLTPNKSSGVDSALSKFCKSIQFKRYDKVKGSNTLFIGRKSI
jgi:spermidine synthase